jgi:hypothetical protein
MEFLKLIGTAYKVPYRVLYRVWIISFPTYMVLQCSPYKSTSQYFFNFLFKLVARVGLLVLVKGLWQPSVAYLVRK